MALYRDDASNHSSEWMLHCIMVFELSYKLHPGEVGSNIQNKWQRFIEAFSLTEVEKTPLKNVDDLLQILLEKEKIQIGNYSVVKIVFTDIQLCDCLKIVEKYETLISDPQHNQQGLLKADLSIAAVNPPAAEEQAIYNRLKDNLSKMLQSIQHLAYGEFPKPSKESQEDYREALNLAKQMNDVFTVYNISLKTSQSDDLSLLFKYKSTDAHLKLWDMYSSGELLSTLQSGIVTDFILRECNVESLQLQVFLSSFVDVGKQEDPPFAGAQIPVLRLNEQFCVEHNNRKITMVCRDCDHQLVCPSCIAKQHCRHEFIELEDFIEEQKQSLSLSIKEAETKTFAIEKRLQASKEIRTELNRKINTSKEKLNERRNKLIKIVDDWLDVNIREAEHIQAKSNSTLDDVDKMLQEHLQNLQTEIKKCEVILTSSAYQDFASLELTVRSYLEKSLPRIPHVQQADLDSKNPVEKDVYAIAGNLSIKPLVLADDEYAVLQFHEIDADLITRNKRYSCISDMWTGNFDNNPALIKVYRRSPMTWEEFFSEALILRTSRHRQIIRLYGVCFSKDPIAIVMEYMSNGNLSHYLKKNGERMTKQQMLAISAQIADGMAYVSLEKIVHNFLAAQNILVGDVNTVKIANFSMAIRVSDHETEIDAAHLAKVRYPLKWMAPECLEGRVTLKSDVWSFGILLWETMSLGKTPYQEISVEEAVQMTKRGYKMSRPKDCEEPIYDIMLKCWNTSPTERPTYEFLYNFFDDYHVAAESVYGSIHKTRVATLDSSYTRRKQGQQKQMERPKSEDSATSGRNEQATSNKTTTKTSKYMFWK